MNYKKMGRFTAQLLCVTCLFMLPPLGISIFRDSARDSLAFGVTIGVGLALAGALWLLSRGARSAFHAREGLVCAGVGWILMGLLGCLPFVLSGCIPNFVDALFETVSGFTTTGASVVADVEALPRGMLFWRSFTHWIGGMGVLVFLLAILPASPTGGAMHLLRAESPGPDVGKIVPRMRKTAFILYAIYVVLTVLDVIFLLFGGMSLFDSLCIAFGTAGTGGFGVRNDSMMSYSPYIQVVTTVFLLLFGINFNCHYLLLLGRVRELFKDEELRTYLLIVAGSVALVTVNIFHLFASFGQSLRHAAFQVASIMTTAGFATCNFDTWPAFSRGLLLCLMMVGACAGSTGGGIKVARIVLLMKGMARNIRRAVRPQQVQAVKMNGRAVDEKVLSGVNSYLAAYVLLVIVSFLLISFDGFSVTSNFSAVMACFNNIGPGFDAVGATCTYAGYGALSKLVLIFDMLAGRLEIFPILILFLPNTWKRA